MFKKFHFELKIKHLALFLKWGYLVSLIPLLWIGYYNYPSADDYSIGSNCRQTFVATHSVFATIIAGVVRAFEDWRDWMGYFTSNFLMAIPPSTFGERVYILTSLLMLGILSLGTIYLFRQIFVKGFHAERELADIVSYLTLFLTIQRMQGAVEAFYWYSGAANYIFVHGMCLFFYGLVLSLGMTNQEEGLGRKRRRLTAKIVATTILGFLVGGGNQMTALNAAVVLLVAILILAYQKKWKQQKKLLFPIAGFYLGFLLNIAAPGNWVRAADATGMNPVKAILISFYYGLDYCINEWSGWPMLLLVLILIPVFYHMAEKTTFSFPYPAVVVLFGYCLVCAMMTPPLFAVGNIGAERLQALTYSMYVLCITLSTGYVTGWVRRKLQKEEILSHEKAEQVKTENRCFAALEGMAIVACLLFFMFAAVLTVVPEPRYFTGTSALTDLMNGSARSYGTALHERMEQYRSGEQNIVVEKLPAQPELLYFADITEDPEDWTNQGLCRYYQIESVKVRE